MINLSILIIRQKNFQFNSEIFVTSKNLKNPMLTHHPLTLITHPQLAYY